MKILQLGGELFHADGQTVRQTWRSEQSVFAIFANAPKNSSS